MIHNYYGQDITKLLAFYKQFDYFFYNENLHIVACILDKFHVQ